MQGNLARFCLPFLLLAAASCSQGQPSPNGGEYGQGLELGPGVTVSSANYTISGPNGFTSGGTVPIGDSADISVVVSNLPVGMGYELIVSGTASDGLTVCDGTATFDVATANSTVTVPVHLECAVPSGDVALTGTVNICPVIDDLSAAPVNLLVGGVASLSVSAHDSDSGPAALSYRWMLNGIPIAGKTAPNLAFTCTKLGQVTIAALVSDGDPKCIDSSSVKVSCE